MDPTAGAVLAAQTNNFSDAAITQFGTVLPIAFGVLITVAVAFFAIKVFRALIHM